MINVCVGSSCNWISTGSYELTDRDHWYVDQYLLPLLIDSLKLLEQRTRNDLFGLTGGTVFQEGAASLAKNVFFLAKFLRMLLFVGRFCVVQFATYFTGKS